MWLLGIISVTLIAYSSQSVTADDAALIGVDIIKTKDSEFQVHLQTVVRDSQGQLISVTEGRSGWTTIALPGKTIAGVVEIDGKQVTTTLTDNVFGAESKKKLLLCMVQNMRTIFHKMSLTDKEMRILLGIFSSLKDKKGSLTNKK